MHAPPPQTSFVVHAFPSSQAAVLFARTQPVAALQLSSVHPSASSQFRGDPLTQTVPKQESNDVHALPSSHTLSPASQAAQTVRSTPDERFPQLPRWGSAARTR